MWIRGLGSDKAAGLTAAILLSGTPEAKFLTVVMTASICSGAGAGALCTGMITIATTVMQALSARQGRTTALAVDNLATGWQVKWYNTRMEVARAVPYINIQEKNRSF